MSLSKQLHSIFSQVELFSPGAKAMPTKFAIPFPMQIRAIIFFERNATPVRSISGPRDFGVVQHNCLKEGRERIQLSDTREAFEVLAKEVAPLLPYHSS